MANYLEFTPNVSWAKVRVYYEESYDSASKTTTLTITSVEAMSTQYTADYYVDGVLNVNGEAALVFNSAAGDVLVDVKSTNAWYPITYSATPTTPITATVQISHDTEVIEKVTIELTGNRFTRFAFYTVDEENGNGWGVNESQEVALTAGPTTWDSRSFWIGVALGLCGKPLHFVQREPVAYLYNGVRLPKLPEWDKMAYPYAFIREHESNIMGSHFRDATLYVLPKVEYLEADNGNWCVSLKNGYRASYILVSLTGEATEYDYDGKEWSVFEDGTGFGAVITDFDWANFDVLNEDGSTYLATSDPVPVYE